MLRDQIQTDQIQALKAGNKEKLEALRYILSQIKNKEIDKKENLNDEETIALIRKELKQLNESIEAFKKGNREDLASQMQGQHDVLVTYLPKEISDEELLQEVKNLIAANQDLYNQNQKAIIGLCMKQLRSKAAPERIMKALNMV